MLEAGDFPGDHAFNWADITYTSVLGYIPPHPNHPLTRRLRLFDSKTTQRYLALYEEYIQEARIEERLQQLEKTIVPGTPLTPAQIREVENIDRDRTKCMLKAERKCRKLKMGAVAFSEATAVPRKKIEFWNLALQKKHKVKVSSRLWR